MRDLATQVQQKLSTQLESRVRDLEAATCCHIVTEMQNTGRFLQRHVDKPPRQRRRTWFLNAMFFS